MINDVTFEQQCACVKREIALRERVYPKFVFAGKMTQSKANAEISAMRAVLVTLEREMARQRPGLF